jgi:hypothetical protein
VQNAGIRGTTFSICSVHFHNVESVSSPVSEFHTETVVGPVSLVSEGKAA